MTSKRASLRWFAGKADSVDWDAVYAELMPRVFNFFRYRVENVAAAEDLTATTLMRAWQGRERHSEDLSSFPTGYSGSHGTSPPTIFGDENRRYRWSIQWRKPAGRR